MFETVIDLRSDSVTLPTGDMYRAMREARLGNDLFGEDPSVRELEEMAAEKTGKEAGLFVPSVTMGNLIALTVHGQPGEAAIVESQSHIFRDEIGGIACIAGLLPIPIEGKSGVYGPEAVRDAVMRDVRTSARATVLCLENTHNRAGGVAITPDSMKAVCQVARENGLSTHLDAARIFNAAVALGTEVRDLVADFDTVVFSLSKGLSAPLGSLITGTKSFMERALRARRRLGGTMYQVGVVAAAGIVALRKMVDRLAEDNDTARLLAEGISSIPPLGVDLESVQTNIVIFDVGDLGVGAQEFAERLSTHGVMVSVMADSRVRMVTHRHVLPKDVTHVLDAVRKAVAWFAATDT